MEAFGLEGVNILTDLLIRWIDFLKGLLASAGVPEADLKVAALGVTYLIVTSLVILGIVILFILRRRRKALSATEREQALPEEEAEETAEVVQGEAGEEASAPLGPEVGKTEEEGLVPGTPVSVPPVEEEIAPVEVPQPLPAEIEEVPVPAPSLFERMRAGLARTHAGFVGRIDALLSGGGKIDEETLEDLEEILITADFGMKTTQELIGAIEARLSRGGADADALRDILRSEIEERLRQEAAPLAIESRAPFVLMVVGVNGVGKTTTIGKLAWQFAKEGKKVLLGAGDTFRAAAAEQLSVWGERAGVDVIRHDEGADPAAVAFDAAKAAVARKADILILDTAGRLHTKINLMEELKKIRRVLSREIPDAPHETLLVLDATTGQNALTQARLFKETVDVSGIALTKLDGTAKGGIVVAIGAELGLPVKFVGIGEGAEDLRPFDPEMFAEALFQKD